MDRGAKVAGGDRLGKTIIFARNEAHANFIARCFDQGWPEYGGGFAQVITHRTPYAQHLIDQFGKRDTAPHIAISVDMLDTGVDVPEIVNLMFFKPVRSKTKFWQMMGRGTRLCTDLLGENHDKNGFFVFDLYQNFEFFNQDLPRSEGSVQQSLSERLFRRRADLLLALDTQRPELGEEPGSADTGTDSDAGLRWDVARRLHADVAGMNLDNFLVRPHRKQVEAYSDLTSWRHVDMSSHNEVTDHLAGLPTGHSRGRRQRRSQAVRSAYAANAARRSTGRRWIRAPSGTGSGDRLGAAGPDDDPRHPSAAGSAGGPDRRRMVAGRHTPDAGEHAPSGAQTGEADRAHQAEPGLHRLRRRSGRTVPRRGQGHAAGNRPQPVRAKVRTIYVATRTSWRCRSSAATSRSPHRPGRA